MFILVLKFLPITSLSIFISFDKNSGRVVAWLGILSFSFTVLVLSTARGSSLSHGCLPSSTRSSERVETFSHSLLCLLWLNFVVNGYSCFPSVLMFSWVNSSSNLLLKFRYYLVTTISRNVQTSGYTYLIFLIYLNPIPYQDKVIQHKINIRILTKVTGVSSQQQLFLWYNKTMTIIVTWKYLR